MNRRRQGKSPIPRGLRRQRFSGKFLHHGADGTLYSRLPDQAGFANRYWFRYETGSPNPRRQGQFPSQVLLGATRASGVLPVKTWFGLYEDIPPVLHQTGPSRENSTAVQGLWAPPTQGIRKGPDPSMAIGGFTWMEWLYDGRQTATKGAPSPRTPRLPVGRIGPRSPIPMEGCRPVRTFSDRRLWAASNRNRSS